MIKDTDLVERYYDFKEENDRLNQSIISEVKRKSFKDGVEKGIQRKQREMVLNMYKDDVSLDLISKYTSLTIEEIEEIIHSSE